MNRNGERQASSAAVSSLIFNRLTVHRFGFSLALSESARRLRFVARLVNAFQVVSLTFNWIDSAFMPAIKSCKITADRLRPSAVIILVESLNNGKPARLEKLTMPSYKRQRRSQA